MKVLGLMSGTSADGIDVAICEINGHPPALELINSQLILYPAGFQKQILEACELEKSRVDVLSEMNFQIGELFAAAALQAIQDAGLQPTNIDLIGSHGQTVWHNVATDGNVTSTLQLGEAAVIAERTGITTISNFRTRDVAVGGQGAPLTAYADWLLLRHPEHWRAVQNIGGMGNVTFLPPLNDDTRPPLAFDTGPGNALIDSAVMLLTDGAQMFDKDGKMARSGRIDEDWLETLSSHKYYDRKPPKTTGRELFGAEMARDLVTVGHDRGFSAETVVATLTTLTAQSIVDAYHRYAPAPIREVIVGGGGRHNSALMSMLREMLRPATVLTHEDIGMDSDHKEAIVFALLAHETWHARPGTLPALTGAQKATILGDITPGLNYAACIQETWCE